VEVLATYVDLDAPLHVGEEQPDQEHEDAQGRADASRGPEVKRQEHEAGDDESAADDEGDPGSLDP